MFLEQRLSNPKQAHSFEGLFWISGVYHGAPSPPSPPPPPDYAAANRAGVIADVQTLGSRKAIENAAKFGGKALMFGVEERERDALKEGYTFSKGKYYDADKKVVDASTALTGQKEKYFVQLFNEKGDRLRTPREISQQEAIIDFAGKSDVDSAKALAEFQRKEADVNAQALLDITKKYSSDFTDIARKQLQELDPTAYGLREQLGRTLQEELAAGQELTPAEERQVTQSVRGAQVARGNIYGGAPIAQEAISRYGAGVQRQQQRMANVQSYLGLNPIVAQAGGLSALQQGAVPYRPSMIPQGVNINPMAGKQGTDFALGVYDNQTRQYQAQTSFAASTYTSPLQWIQGIGGLI